MPKRDFGNPFGGGAGGPAGKAAFGNPFDAAPAAPAAPAPAPVAPQRPQADPAMMAAMDRSGFSAADMARQIRPVDVPGASLALNAGVSRIEADARRKREDDAAAIRQARSDALYWNDDRAINFKTGDEARAYSADVDRQIREHAYGRGFATRGERLTGAALGPVQRFMDLDKAGPGSTGRLIDLPLELRRDRLAQERQTQDDSPFARIATGAAGVLPVMLPGVGTARGMAMLGAAGDPDNPLRGGLKGAAFGMANKLVPQASTTLGNMGRQAVAGPIIGSTVAGVFGDEYNGEGAASDAILSGVLGANVGDIPRRARVRGIGRNRAKVEDARAATAYAAAEQRAGMVDPARPEAEAYREAQAEALDRLFLSRGIEDDVARQEMVRQALAAQPDAFTYGRGHAQAPPMVSDPLMGQRPMPPAGTVEAQPAPAGTESVSVRTGYGREAAPPQPDVLGVVPGRGSLPVDPRSPGARGVRPQSMQTDYAAEAPAPVRDPLGFKAGEAPLGPGVYGTENVSPVVEYAAPPPPAADPLLPETPGKGMATSAKKRGKGMARPKAPVATMAEASEIKREYIEQGGPIDHVASEGRVQALVETGQLPEPKVLPDGTVEAGYDPQAREKGLIEPGAMPAVDAAEAAGVKVVSSGVDKQTGEGYAVGRAPDGQVVEVKAPASVPASEVRAPSDPPAPADPGRGGTSPIAEVEAAPVAPKGIGSSAKRRGKGMGKKAPDPLPPLPIPDGPPMPRLKSKDPLMDRLLEAEFNEMEVRRREPTGVPKDDPTYRVWQREVYDAKEAIRDASRALSRRDPKWMLRDFAAASDAADADVAAGADPAPVKSAPSGDFDIDPATGLPNYLSKVKVTAPKVKPMPRSGEAGAANIGPVVDLAKAGGKAAIEEAKGAARVVASGARAVARGFGGLSNLVSGRGKTGRDIANRIPEAVVAKEDFDAATVRSRLEALRATQGGAFSGKKSKAVKDAMALKPVGDGSSLRPAWVDWIEGDGAPGTPEGGRITESMRGWLRDMHDVWADRPGGRFMQGINGKWEQAQPWQGEVRVVPFMRHPNLRRILQEGPGGKDWDALVAGAKADNPNIPEAAIIDDLTKKSEQAVTEARDPSEFDVAGEHRRGIKMPWAIPDGRGGVIHLGVVNPHHYVKRYSNARASAEGVDTVWGQGPNSTLEDIRKAFVAENPRNASDFVKVFRSLHGLTPEATEVQAGTPAATAKRRWGHVINTFRALGRQAAAITDVSSWLFSNDAQGIGLLDKVRGDVVAAADFVHQLRGKGHSPGVEILVDEGVKTQNVSDWTPNPEAGPVGRSIDYANKLSREVLTRPLEEGQETAVGAGATLRLGKLGASERDVIDLKTYAVVDDVTARDFLAGKLPPEKMQEVQKRFLRGFVKKGLATNLSPVERSQFEHNNWVRYLVKFPGWPTHNARFSIHRVKTAWESYKQGLTGRDAQGNKLSSDERIKRGLGGAAAGGKFLAYKAAEGLVSTLAFAIVSPWTDTKKEIRKLMADPKGYLSETAFWASFGGPWAGMLRGAFQDGPGNVVEKLAGAAAGATVPSQMIDAVGRGDTINRLMPATNIFDKPASKGRDFGEPRTPRRRGRGIGRGG